VSTSSGYPGLERHRDRGARDHRNRSTISRPGRLRPDSLVEIGASTVVLWELADTDQRRQRTALQLIGGAFLALAGYIAAQSLIVLATGYHPRHSSTGIAWTPPPRS